MYLVARELEIRDTYHSALAMGFGINGNVGELINYLAFGTLPDIDSDEDEEE